MIDQPPQLVDEAAHQRQRDRAAAGYARHDFLKKAVAERVVDRLDAVRREFPLVADIGCHGGQLARMLMDHPAIGRVLAQDPSPAMAAAASENGCEAIAAPYENLPFAEESLDGIFSAFALHWVNDLPGMLLRLRRLLKPDGLMVVALPGGETLSNLRAALTDAETAVLGGMSPRVMPMADIRDMGGLIGRAGLALPVADSDSLTVTWPDAFALMRDLRGMAEGNALAARRRQFTPREVMMRTALSMQERFADADGRIEAVFEVVTLTGWAPHESQQQPLHPGSASARLADALGSSEYDPEQSE